MSNKSPARLKRMAVIAHAQAATGEISTEAMQLQMQFRNHLQALKAIHSIQDKAVLKAEILPEYAGYIDGILEAGQLPPNDTLYPVLLLWTIDSGDLDQAATMAPLVIFNPDAVIHLDDFQRTAPVAVFEQFAEQLPIAGISDTALAYMLVQAEAKTEAGTHLVDMPDKVRAKFFRAAAELIEDREPRDALHLYESALTYDAKAGVKQKIDKLQKQLA